MNTKKLITGIATAGIFVSAFASSAFADTDVTIQGTGALSSNGVSVTESNVDVMNQSSKTNAVTLVGVNQNTGGNSASFNTGGGGVNLTSGNTHSTVGTTVAGGSNTAVITSPCGCAGNGNTTATIKNTGALSGNSITINSSNTNVVSQKTKTNAVTVVSVSQKTGNNNASFNTGNGTKTVTSGNATSTVATSVSGGSNTLVH
jgi:hypothetical protein